MKATTFMTNRPLRPRPAALLRPQPCAAAIGHQPVAMGERNPAQALGAEAPVIGRQCGCRGLCAGIVFGILPRSDDRPGIAGFVYPEPKTISPFK